MSRIVLIYRPGHPKANERGFVDSRDIGYADADQRTLILSDRHYENKKAPDGTDIGSAKKHRAWVKENNLVYFGDTSPGWRERRAKSVAQDRSREVKQALISAYKRHKGY